MESVRSQKFKDYEHIIIDGASTDASVDVIKEFLKDPDYASHVTYWCSEKDSGVYNAMNKGLSKASGIYVSIMNSGDSFTAGALDYFSDFEISAELPVLYGVANFYSRNIFHGAESRCGLTLPEITLPHQACFIPLELHKKYGFYDESLKISADYDFLLKVFCAEVPFCYMNRIVCNYDLDGISGKFKKLLMKENKIVRKRHIVPKKKSLVIMIYDAIIFLSLIPNKIAVSFFEILNGIFKYQ